MACEACHKAKASCVKKEGYDQCLRCEQHAAACIPHKRARRGSKTVKKQPCEKRDSKEEEVVNGGSSVPAKPTKRKREEETKDTIELKSENQAPSEAVKAVKTDELQRAWTFPTQQDLDVVVRALIDTGVPGRIHSQWLKLTRWNLDVDDKGLTAIAVRGNRMSTVKWLFKQGVNIRRQYPNGELLTLAIDAGSITMMKFLLSQSEQIKEHHLKRAWVQVTPRCRCICAKNALLLSSKCLCRCEENAKHLEVVQETLRLLYDKAAGVTIDDIDFWTRMIEETGPELLSAAMPEPSIFLWHMLNKEKFALSREQSEYVIKAVVEDCSNINTFEKVIERSFPGEACDVTHLVKMLVEMSIRDCCQQDDEFTSNARKGLTVEDLTDECVNATKIRFLLKKRVVDLHRNNCDLVKVACRQRCQIVQDYLKLQCMMSHDKPNSKRRRPKGDQNHEVPDLALTGFAGSFC